jgi:hypothetical protein
MAKKTELFPLLLFESTLPPSASTAMMVSSLFPLLPLFYQRDSKLFADTEYIVKKVSDFPVLSQGDTNQTLPGRE